jgi:Uma2 family endonuclease
VYVESTARDAPRPDEDQRVFLHDITWAQFEAIVAMRGETRVPRITLVDGELELMSPSRSHEGIVRMIGRLVEAYADHVDLDCNAYGSWLLKSSRRDCGAEPDGCYVFGDRRTHVPDLAIEVVWTSGGLSKLEVYRRLGVREVWFWRRKSARMEAFELVDGDYQPRETSAVLPGLAPRRLERFLDYDHQSRSLRAFRAELTGDEPPSED